MTAPIPGTVFHMTSEDDCHELLDLLDIAEQTPGPGDSEPLGSVRITRDAGLPENTVVYDGLDNSEHCFRFATNELLDLLELIAAGGRA